MTTEKVVLGGDDLRRALVRIAHEIVEKQSQPEQLALVGIHRRGAILARRLRDLLSELLDLEQAGHEGVQPRGEMRTTAMDADERERPVGVLLDDLVRYPHERAADVVLVQDDALLRHMVLPGLTGPG